MDHGEKTPVANCSCPDMDIHFLAKRNRSIKKCVIKITTYAHKGIYQKENKATAKVYNKQCTKQGKLLLVFFV